VLEKFSNADLAVERAQSDDAARVAELLRAAYAPHAALGLNFTAATVTESLIRERMKRHEVYVLRRGGRIIGTVTLRTKEDEHGVAGYVNSLAIEPGLQREGLGGTLLERAEREALRRGLPRMRLDTAKSLTPLIRWYEQRGYRAVGARSTGRGRPTTPSCWRNS
jgi:ribosomal protein S18 acetylase RimI-like enzyme